MYPLSKLYFLIEVAVQELGGGGTGGGGGGGGGGGSLGQGVNQKHFGLARVNLKFVSQTISGYATQKLLF